MMVQAGFRPRMKSVNADRYAILQGLATQVAEYIAATGAENDAWVYEVMRASMAEMVQALGHELPPGLLEDLVDTAEINRRLAHPDEGQRVAWDAADGRLRRRRA